MNNHIPPGTPEDDYDDCPAGPGEPRRLVNWSDDDNPTGCGLIVARVAVVAAAMVMLWRMR